MSRLGKRCIGVGWMVLSAAACGGPPTTGDALSCGDGQRVALDCSSEIAYQGVKTGGGVEILSLGGGHASYEEQALREVNAELEQYVAVQSRVCRDYNGCILSKEEYQTEAAKTRARFETANQLAAKIQSATGDGRKEAIGSLYSAVVPEETRPGDVSLQIKIDAELPEAAGGGTVVVKPGAPLPTDGRLKFAFQPSKPAHLYVYQVSADGSVNVLFPNSKIQNVPNPIPAGTPTWIPPGVQRIRVTEDDEGVTENVYILASVEPIAAIDHVLEAASAGAVKLTDDPLLNSMTRGDPFAIASCPRSLSVEDPCEGTRGLELAPAGASMLTRTSPGDDVIVKVFPFEHVAQVDYQQKAKAFELKQQGARGIIIED